MTRAVRDLVAVLLAAAPAYAAQTAAETDRSGRQVIARVCGPCHTFAYVTQTKRTPRQWRDVIDNMITRGARGSSSDMQTIVDWLTLRFGRPEEAAAAHASIVGDGVRGSVAFKNAAVPREHEWTAYGRDPGGTRYAPAAQITPRNVARLRRVWTWHHGDKGRTFQTTPLVIKNKMYVTTPAQQVVALEPETGRELWRFDPHTSRGGVTRGVAYWPGDAQASPRLLMGTIDGRLLAIDAETGSLVPAFGDNGQIDLRIGVADGFPKQPYGITTPPAIYRDLAILGPELQESTSRGPSGDPRAFNVRTGRLVWRFHLVPRPSEPGNETWGSEGWKDRSGPSQWGPIAVDTVRGHVFLPTGNPGDSMYGADRKGQNRYANSVIALDAATGQLLWQYQMTHHDIFDYDVGAQPTLIDIVRGNRRIPAIAEITKMGLLFILDRLTGEPIFGVEERRVPRSDVPGEESWPTQPFPAKPPPLARMSVSDGEIAQITPESERFCKELLARRPNFGPYTPFTTEGSTLFPSTIGGGNWGGVAFEPSSGYVFVNTSNIGSVGRMAPGKPDAERWIGLGVPYRNVDGYARFVDQNRYPCNALPWGELAAVNANTGDVVWRVPLGSYPELEARGIRNAGAPSLGGPIVTGGGLVFIGATNDRRFRAFDARTGKELCTADLETTANSTPMTFIGRDGKQYVVIAAGGAGHLGGIGPVDPGGDSLIAFALP